MGVHGDRATNQITNFNTMQSAQESKQELEAAIRYAENAISSANKTIESMEFRQEMAQKNYQEQTGREAALQEERDMLEKNVKYLRDENERLKRDVEFYTKEYNGLVQQKEASSGPCGCQAYRDLEEARGRAEGEVELLQRTIKELEERADSLGATIQRLKRDQPTMPVIPKDVAIAIFREGIQTGVDAACSEIDGQRIDVEESEYVGGFEVSFTKEIDLEVALDLDWMRGKCGDYTEDAVIDSLKGLCADKEFECRIQGVDDNNNEQNSTT